MARLTAGTYGPYKLQWLEKTGLWKIEAQSRRAMEMFRYGAPAEDGKARIFGNTEAAERRAAAELERLRQMRDEAREIELPEIDGLKFSRSNDGRILIRGRLLQSYRVLAKAAAERRGLEQPPSDFAHASENEIYAAPQDALALAEAFKAEEAPIRALEKGPLPPGRPRWLALHLPPRAGLWRLEGPLASLDYMNIPPIQARRCGAERAGHNPEILIYLTEMDEILEAAERRIEEIEAQIAGEEAQGFFAFVDGTLERFDRRFRNCFGAEISMSRDGPWLNVRHDFRRLGVYAMQERDWRGCRNERIWRKSLLPLLAPGFPAYRREIAVEKMFWGLERIVNGGRKSVYERIMSI